MTAPVGIKRLALAVIAVVLVGFAAVLVLPFLMPADAVRDAVKAEIHAVTGLDPVLQGRASVALFPAGRVSFDDVTLGDNRTGAPALTAERVVARLRFFPILIGRIEIADVSLVRPTIAIVFEADRSSNWSGHIEALARNLKRQPNPAASFSEIRIEDGTIILRDQTNNVVETLSHVEFALAWPSIARSFAATGGFIWRDEQMAASISLTDFVAALQGDRSGLKIRLAGAPLKFGFDGYISHRPILKMEGTVAADAASLRDTIRWAGREPPPGAGFGPFALKGQANVVGGNIGLSRAHIEVDGNVGEGVLSLSGHGVLQGTLATESLDLTPYISTVRLLGGAGDHGWDGSPIMLDGIEAIDTDLRLSAAGVTIANAKLGRTAVAATLHHGQFTVAIGESEAFGGMVRGTLGIAKSTAGADLNARLQFSNVDLEQCIGELLGIRRLEGKGNLAFAVESSGASVYALTKGLNGTATLASRKGAITGLNIEQLLKRIERSPLSGGGDFRVGKTPYDTLTVNLKIADGIANVEDMRMEGAVVGLGLSGIASIPAREVDLRGTASLLQAGVATGQSPLPTFELPFMVQGPWNDPIMLPDAQSLIQRSGAAAPLLDALRNRGTAEAVRSVLERLRGPAPSRPPSSPPAETAPTLAGASVPPEEAQAPSAPTAAGSLSPEALPGPQ